MKQVVAEQISGDRVYADGKWLYSIGNKNILVGDTIWTDGRVVYGNVQTGGEGLVLDVRKCGDIPVLSYLQKINGVWSADRGIFGRDGLAGCGRDSFSGTRVMVSNATDWKFLSTTGNVDAVMDKDGGVYMIYSKKYANGIVLNGPWSMYSVVPQIRKNDVLIKDFQDEISEYLMEMHERESAALIAGAPNYDRRTEFSADYYLESKVFGGYVDVGGNYSIIVWLHLTEQMYCTLPLEDGNDDENFETYNSNSYMLLVLSNKGNSIYSKGYIRRWEDAYSLSIDGCVMENEWQLPESYEFKFPLNDGYYLTCETEKSHLTDTFYQAYKLTAGKIYTPEGEMICTGKFDFKTKLVIRRITRGTHILRIGDTLFTCRGGELNRIGSCSNMRFVPMQKEALRKWKGE